MNRHKAMRIVVTGAGGFIGDALAARLATDPTTAGQGLVLVDRASFRCPPGAEAIVGDIGDPATLAAIADTRPDCIFHLAALPGGASEADPILSRRVNLDASLALIETLPRLPQQPRLIYASSIGVFGVPLPTYVDDDTVARPTLTYGTHKSMVEAALADAVRRGDIDALALRLPGVVARPAGQSGLKSAFMSDLFHRLRDGTAITLPVSAAGHVWITSLARCIDNLIGAAAADMTELNGRTVITMPALHVSIGDLAKTIAAQTGADPGLVGYAPEPALEAQFAAYPPLATPAAEAIGLGHDGDLAALVARTLTGIERPSAG